jgi:arylsulfatase A-like enzyme
MPHCIGGTVKGVAKRVGTRTWSILFVALFGVLWLELPPTVRAVMAPEGVAVARAVHQAAPPGRKLTTAQATADLVVLVSIDGFRPDVITPDMRGLHRLFLQGLTAHVAKTIDKSATLPSHASMVSGVDPDQHGLDFNAYRPEHAAIARPTVFSVAHAAGLPTAMFVGKAKLKLLLNKPTDATFTMAGMNCDKLLKEALPYLREAQSGLVFLHFADPDSAGHRYGWMTQEYQDAAAKADRCLERVIDTIADAGKEDRTLLLVTADHGGHGRSHGTRLDVDARIPWYAWGAGAQRGRVSRTVNTVDTAATALSALGLERPAGMHGRPVDEAISASCGPTGLPLVGTPIDAEP